MHDGMRRSVGLALLLGILCAPPARAQEPAASRPWSDPPTKPVEAPAATEAAKPASATEPAAATPTRAASRKSAGQPARTAFRKVERPALAHRKAGRRERLAAGPPRRRTAEAAPRRVLAVRPPPPETPAVRLARPLPPDMPMYRDVDLWVDARADRIRRARDGGFLVMRRSTIEDPMGRRMQILRPLDDEDE